MSIFRSGERPPHWCEVTGFEVFEVSRQPRAIEIGSEKNRLLVTRGTCRLTNRVGSQVLGEGQFWDFDEANAPLYADAGDRTAQVLMFSGKWGTELGGCGIFKLTPSTPAWWEGDPVSYPKSTTFDSHYHDCDEYWVIIEGGGTVVVGSRAFEVEAGDCVPIGMGHHHDLPRLRADLKGAYFETTLEGKKRFGHLWEHKHGPAEVRADRV